MPDQDQRYRGVSVGTGDWIVYDTENEAAWIQSDYFVKIDRTKPSQERP